MDAIVKDAASRQCDSLGTSMDAFFRSLLLLSTLASVGAGFRTANFEVTASTTEFARRVGEAAEVYREELAIEWLGKSLPGNWSTPCPIHVTVGSMGAGGATTFNFQNGEVYGWKMDIQGSEERILDSVLPHEINHTIFACYFRRPLPRWADEGAASLIEHGSERLRLRKIHDQVMGTNRKIPLQTLLEMKSYPQDKQRVLTLYAEGHSLADFLIQKSDKTSFIRFLQMAHEKGWDTALHLYNYTSTGSLEKDWDQWVLAGCPSLNSLAGSQLADSRGASATQGTTIRAQSPDEIPLPSPLLKEGKPSPPRNPNQVLKSADGPEDVTTDIATAASPVSRQGLELPLLAHPSRIGTARVLRELPNRSLPLSQ
jgi:hypothetical protein